MCIYCYYSVYHYIHWILDFKSILLLVVLCDGENIADFITWFIIFIYHSILKKYATKNGIIACFKKILLWDFLGVYFCG